MLFVFYEAVYNVKLVSRFQHYEMLRVGKWLDTFISTLIISCSNILSTELGPINLANGRVTEEVSRWHIWDRAE